VDVNRDGFADIIIGANKANINYGAAHVVFGWTSPMDSSVFHLGNGVISLNGTSNIVFGNAVTLEKNVGTNSRRILVCALSSFINSAYYFHDFIETDTLSVSPTTSPTFPPNVAPTFSPSASPTQTPTFVPSVVPTFTPSRLV
jgi:hypothetical protein